MPQKMSHELETALHRFAQWNVEAQRIARAPHQRDGIRSRIAASSFQTSLEHSVAIATLLAGELIASAHALYRPQFEAFARGMWFLYCASPEQIEQFASGVESIPRKIDVLCAAVKEATKTEIVGAIREKDWDRMNDMTHGGTIQVTNRMKTNVMESNFDHSDALEQIKGTAVIAGWAAEYLMKATGREDDARKLDALYEATFPTEWGGKAGY